MPQRRSSHLLRAFSLACILALALLTQQVPASEADTEDQIWVAYGSGRSVLEAIATEAASDGAYAKKSQKLAKEWRTLLQSQSGIPELTRGSDLRE